MRAGQVFHLQRVRWTAKEKLHAAFVRNQQEAEAQGKTEEKETKTPRPHAVSDSFFTRS